ncbi:MAG: DUF4115 domain-containing protein [Elusimicrobia bacterium]|nr:DUF4115 domain-containing protein [Elusimicrobiota bacterium]MBD3412569.1 DUF4115 domain-containing protein [Elusimicrobiota bacterium]
MNDLSIGHTLKIRREQLKISLNKIHHDTHISVGFLEALEEERFDRFPAEIYLIGFLRRYAQYLRLDAEALVAAYKNSKPAPAADEPVHEETPKHVTEQHAVSIQRVIFLLGVVFFGFGLFIFMVFVISEKKSTVEDRSEPVTKRFLSSRHSLKTTRTPLELSIHAHQKTWLRVESDDVMVFEGYLPEQKAEHWRAGKHFTVLTNSWEAMVVTLNGNTIDPQKIAPDKRRLVLNRAMVDNES